MPATRRLAAILATDVAGYSRLMGDDEEGTLDRLRAHRRGLVDPKIAEHHGRIVKTTGDGMLVEFASVIDAVRCAAEVQRAMLDRDGETPDERRIRFRVGINLGDVIAEDDDIFGDGVNVAARLEALAEPGGVCVSGTVYDQIRDRLRYPFEDLGEQTVKNITRPVRAYALSAAAVATLPTPDGAVSATATPSQARLPRLSIVVLPFTNLSDDRDQEYFADGITEDLTTDLSRIADSFVIARNTAFTYKGKSVDAKQIGRELGVHYVLEGSVRRAGDRVRVNVQLIDAESGAHVWADRLDVERSDLAIAQDTITGRLARRLGRELVRDINQHIEHERALDPDARDLVLRGRALQSRPYSAAIWAEALGAFEQALALDPRSIDARIGIASILVTAIADGVSANVEQDQVRAEQLLIEAIERDPERSEARAGMGLLRRLQGRPAEAQFELETAIVLDRNNSHAIGQLGHTLSFSGNPAAAIPYFEKVLVLDPRPPGLGNMYTQLGRCHLFLGDSAKAMSFFTKAKLENPRFWYVHLFLAGAQGLQADIENAKMEIAEALKLKPEVNSIAQWRAVIATQGGMPQYQELMEKTIFAGLRRAGFPEE